MKNNNKYSKLNQKKIRLLKEIIINLFYLLADPTLIKE